MQHRQANRQRARTGQVTRIPAPVRGWNARDSLAQMRPDDAIDMDNFVPEPEAVKLRRGSAEHATGVGSGSVQTLAEYHSGTTRKLIAAGGGALYDATSSGAATSLKSGFSDDRWIVTNFNGLMALCNGADQPQQYDGSSVTDLTFYLINDDCSANTLDWTLGNKWSHDAGNDQFDHATSSTATLDRDILNLETSTDYDIWVKVENRTAGSLTVKFSSASESSTVSSNTTLNFTFTTQSTDDTIKHEPTSDFDGSVSLVQVRKTDITPTSFKGVTVFKNRSYFWANDSQDFWYSDVNVLGGDVINFPLSRVGQFGGKLISIVPWTIGGAASVDEAGVSIQQLMAFVMSSGEVIVYRGTNPGNSDWTLVGLYHIGAPIDERGVTQVAGDAVVLTRDGAMPMSAVMQQGRFNPTAAITDRIRGRFNEAARDWAGNTGWEAMFYPSGPWVLINVPADSTHADQYVMHTVTRGWFRIRGWDARTFGVYNDELYFGTTDGRVVKADTGQDDEGGKIEGRVRSAFTPYANQARVARVRGAQPVISSDGDVDLGISIEADYQAKGIPIDALVTVQTPQQRWEDITLPWELITRTWDQGAGIPFGPWFVRSAQGTVFAIRLHTNSDTGLEWHQTVVRYEIGSGL